MDSNIIIPPVSNQVMDIAMDVYNTMMSNAKHLDKPLCSLCIANKEKGIFVKDHFHGSDVGTCYLHTQLSILTPIQKTYEPVKQIFLRDGHLNEEVMMELLNSSYTTGYHDQEIIYKDDIKLSDTVTEHIVISNHPDLMIFYNQKLSILVEFKATKDWYFKNVACKGMVPNKYYGQVQSYLQALNINFGLLFIKNRHDSNVLPPFVIQYNPEYIQTRFRYLAGVQHLIKQGKNQLVPKEYQSKDTAECKFCDYREHCWEK